MPMRLPYSESAWHAGVTQLHNVFAETDVQTALKRCTHGPDSIVRRYKQS